MSYINSTTPTTTTTASSINQNTFIVATRIHLGNQANPPSRAKLEAILNTFLQTASTIGASRAVIAINPDSKIQGYDLVQALDDALQVVLSKQQKDGSYNNTNTTSIQCDLLKVTPWGKFVPALNALLSYACTTPLHYDNTNDIDENSHIYYAKSILFLSAETTLTKDSMTLLNYHMDFDDTLVVGAALPGHDFSGTPIGNEVPLNGRTCPWNTVALWNLKKIKLGFPLVADGVHKMEDGSPVASGIEEFSTILLHQKISDDGKSKAKLVKVPGIEWEQTFDDEERRKWHEGKMKSKLSRAETHRDVLGCGDYKGNVIHIV